MRTRMWALALGALMMVGFAAAACGGDDSSGGAYGKSNQAASCVATTTTPAGAQPTASPAPAVVKRGKHAQLSDILVDNGGRTLYRFTRDVPATSNCSGACAQTWPPLTVAGGAVAAGQGVSAGLGVITPADGTRQVTYSGQPLYYYAADAAPGDAKGESVGTVWFVVKPAGTLVASGTADPSAAY